MGYILLQSRHPKGVQEEAGYTIVNLESIFFDSVHGVPKE